MEATLFIQDVYHITGIGVIPVGQIKKGTLKIGMQASLNGKVATIKTIEMHREQLQEAHEGDNVGLSLSGVGKRDVSKGIEVIFSDEGALVAQTKPEPIRPKGFFSKLFGR